MGKSAIDACSIIQMMRELMDKEAIFADDNFFAVGGDSMLAVELLARLRERGATGLRLLDIFQSASLGELASRCAA